MKIDTAEMVNEVIMPAIKDALTEYVVHIPEEHVEGEEEIDVMIEDIAQDLRMAIATAVFEKYMPED